MYWVCSIVESWSHLFSLHLESLCCLIHISYSWVLFIFSIIQLIRVSIISLKFNDSIANFLLFEFFYPFHSPSSHLVSNISVLYAISFLIRTILFPKAALDKTCSQKYNSINFIFAKKVGEFFQPLNLLLLPSLFPHGQGFLRKTAGRQWKHKTGIYE